jgi:glutamyl-tRNA synthetase
MSNPSSASPDDACYRGRIAPTPSGYLHLGHARTFWTAQERSRQHAGAIVLRNENLDPDRCRPEFAAAMIEDLRWFGFEWNEGPDIGGPLGPYVQSERLGRYREVWRELAVRGAIYPSAHSRKDIAGALLAPHDESPAAAGAGESQQPGEAIFPASLRPAFASCGPTAPLEPGPVNWRFLVPDGEQIVFHDGRCGAVTRTAGIDFGDFLVWRKDGFPSYELAVVADDHAMRITEVVRGEDLLTSTARQLLLYRALEWPAPRFYHCPLLRDADGRRLAKRADAVSLRTLRAAGADPAQLRAAW